MEKKRAKYPEQASKNKKSKTLLRYAGLGSEMLVMLGGATFLGYKADRWIAWDFPVLLIIFPLLALGLLLWRLIKATESKDG